MNKLLPLFALSILLLVPLGYQSAFAGVADPITFEFEFEVTEIDDDGNLLDGILAVGDTVRGHYTFDRNAPDLEPEDDIGIYSLDAFSFHFDSIVYDKQPPFFEESDAIFVLNDLLPDDAYAVVSTGITQTSGTPLLPFVDAVLLAVDPDSTALSNDSLLLTPPDLSQYEEGFAELFFYEDEFNGFSQSRFDGNSLNISPSELKAQQGDIFVGGIVTSITLQQDEIVGGENLSIDSTALVLAGIQSSAIWMLPVLAGVAGSAFGVLYIKNRRN